MGSISRAGSETLYTLTNGTVYILGGKDSNCSLPICPVEISVYGYRPSIPASATLIALYGVCLFVQIFLGWRYKTWTFLAAMALGCIDEMLGYVGRILLYQNPFKQPGFIMQIVLITIGPVFFAAAIYVLLYQITLFISRKAARFNPIYFYWIFIPCDVVSLILQAVGGALSSTSNGSSNVGVNIALAGLSIQVITLFVFFLLAVDYAIRSRATWSKETLPGRFKIFVIFLTFAGILIFIRCCYRIYELQGGYSRDSAALRDEDKFIALESVMVVVSAFALIVAHPGPVFQNRKLASEVEYSTELDERNR